ncbi:allophanate hydrolase [Dechloromonas denitrificans]|uniref:allophanate hydrolase n=1 Tax=Dechloromonas denitrificans TaxID=281362 RepID=UPI001CF93E17|nr:allophanate hydrolase [Dechloromonas denitrificans]UCV08225.1 allophanate hydrolase [Dechloromonas denitrificans]
MRREALLSLDFASLQNQYGNGLSAVALIDEIYRRLRQHEGDQVWTFVVPREQALLDTERIAALASTGATLPLYGLPFGVKDNIDVAGLPTSAGCGSFTYVAQRTATVVEKLRAAGAILIGKQNMDQFATGLVGIRSPHGYCRNPFDQRYIPGGSSSGSAVAVSTGQVSFSIGSDTGGSGRVPAALNNIIGLKPTPGLVSTYGFLPCNRSFDLPPVFALTTDDAYRVLDAIRGYDDRDIFSVDAPATNAVRQLDEGGFRFGLPAPRQLDFFGDRIAKAQFASAVDHLSELGGEPVEIDFEPFLEAGKLVFDSAFIAERWLTYGAIADSGSSDIHPAVQQSLQASKQYDAADAFQALYRLEELKRAAYDQLAKVDFLAVPTCGTIYRCDEVEADPLRLNTHLGYYTYFANPLRLCAISVPAGLRTDGLPFGVSLLAKPFEDARLRNYAHRLHASFGGKLGATEHPLPH